MPWMSLAVAAVIFRASCLLANNTEALFPAVLAVKNNS